jgi:glycosyltransferase involved in cell wall biosynthesis
VKEPLVTVICLCHNQAPYVRAALESALRQDYPAIELIACDDASSDGSAELIRGMAGEYGFQSLLLRQRQGNCRAFNAALRHAQGRYIIDLAADDLLLPGRARRGVEVLDALDTGWGVHFCDAELIDAANRSLGTHYPRDRSGRLTAEVPQGDVYREVLRRYFISPPTVMVRKEVFDFLGGYDEALAYEDFDFWVRSSRAYCYAFSDEVLVRRRVLPSSLSRRQMLPCNPLTLSTVQVCEKAFALNRSPAENEALAERCRYELKWACLTDHWETADRYRALLRSLGGKGAFYYLSGAVCAFRPPLHRLLRPLILRAGRRRR